MSTIIRDVTWTDRNNLTETIYFYPVVNIYDDKTVRVLIKVDVPKNSFVGVYKTHQGYYSEFRAAFFSRGSEFDKWLEKNNLTLVDVTFKVIK